MRGDGCWLIVVLSIASSGCLVEAKPSPEPKPTFWDIVPIVSQAKMAFLYVIGDSEEAEQTWNNFKNMSHLWEEVKDIDNSIPGYGQVKALIVHLNGDEERAIEIGLAAHKSTCIVGGLILGGPAGALAGAVAADASASYFLQTPVGVVEHALHFQNKTASEHIDVILDLTLLATPGMVGKGKTNVATKSRHNLHFNLPKNQLMSPEHGKSLSGSARGSISVPSNTVGVSKPQISTQSKVQHPENGQKSKPSSQQPEPSTESKPKKKPETILDALVKLEIEEQKKLRTKS